MTGTSRYLVRRLIQNLLILWLISVIAFAITRAAPGGPETFLEDPRMQKEDIAAIRDSYGLNEPLPVQYYKWFTHVIQGDFGRSFIDRRPVMDKILERLPATITLNVATLVVGFIGIPLGVIMAVKRGSFFDRFMSVFNAFGNSAPHWWLGLLIIIYVAVPTRLLPLGGMYTIGKENDILDRLWHLILPATVAAMGDWIFFSRFVRSSILEVIRLDYVRTARAKGLEERIVLFKHAFRNSLIPVVPAFVGSVTGLIGGAVIFESIFSWPGIGRLAEIGRAHV